MKNERGKWRESKRDIWGQREKEIDRQGMKVWVGERERERERERKRESE